MEYTKAVVDPIRQIVPRGQVRGFVEEYTIVDQEVLLLEGETHIYRKPVRPIAVPRYSKAYLHI
jgi:hypothetical protein